MPSPPDRPAAEPAGPLRVFLATFATNAFLVVGSAVLAIPTILLAVVPPRGRLSFPIMRFWSRTVLFLAGVRVTVEREAELDPGDRFVFMANHQSLFDIPVLLSTVPGQTRMLAKRSLFQIPLFGWALWAAGFISIDRKDRARARQGFNRAVERLRGGVSALLFPEGTRSLDGKLLPFKRGGFLLAMKSGLPIVPVGIEGTLAVQPKRRIKVRPGPVTIRFGRPLETSGLAISERGGIEADVRRRIAELARTTATEDRG